MPIVDMEAVQELSLECHRLLDMCACKKKAKQIHIALERSMKIGTGKFKPCKSS